MFERLIEYIKSGRDVELYTHNKLEEYLFYFVHGLIFSGTLAVVLLSTAIITGLIITLIVYLLGW